VLTPAATYSKVFQSLKWEIPKYFNIAVAVCNRHADATPNKTALIFEDEKFNITTYDFLSVKRLSNKLANFFMARKLIQGDRVAIVLSQSIEAGVSHIAAWKAGLISIPMFTLFGEDALQFRLSNSGAKVVITDRENLWKIQAIKSQCPELQHIIVTDLDTEGPGLFDFWKTLEAASDQFIPVKTLAEDPALIIYTSGTTGNPKGALHAHRTLLGHLPGVEFPHEFFPKKNDLMWTPADWAWIGGLMNVLMASWYHGVPVLARRAKKYDPEQALDLMARHRVRNTFMPPTALNLMRKVENIQTRFDINLRTITCAGEPMGAELLHWGRDVLGVSLNEYYGQTECNLVVANCAQLMDIKPGSMGRAVPGHIVEIIDENGQIAKPGSEGDFAVLAPDPVMLLKYWDDDLATTEKFRGGWLIMGDRGIKDDEGYFWFKGRADDVITSAGYRIGPGEIEDCLTKHPAVALAAAIGVPDPVRTESIKAVILLRQGHNGGPQLEKEIRDFVSHRLSPHERPRIIEFVNQLPMTATGKIKRKELRDQAVQQQTSR